MTNKMSATMVFKCILFFLLHIQIIQADRTIKKEILQPSNSTDPEFTIAHISARGKTDELHYLVSTLGYPTILVAYTKPDTDVTVNWEDFTNETLRDKSVEFTPGNVIYTYSLLFTKLIDYNDTKDYSDLDKYTHNSTNWNIYGMNDLDWENLDNQDEGNTVVIKAANTSMTELWQYDGKFSIKLKPFSKSGREDDLPHLEYSENITQFDLTIDHVWTNFTKSRFAIEVIMVVDDKTLLDVYDTKSIDDEYTPGVFYIYNFQSDKGAESAGYLQWKPVCYKDLSRSRGVATFVRNYKQNMQKNTDENTNRMKSTILYAVNGDGISNYMMNNAALNLSFGLTQDGGYNKTQVLTWTASLGFGIPPVDKVSTIVIIIISTGLGIPVVLILFGGLFVCFKKKKDQSGKSVQNGYQRIGSD